MCKWFFILIFEWQSSVIFTFGHKNEQKVKKTFKIISYEGHQIMMNLFKGKSVFFKEQFSTSLAPTYCFSFGHFRFRQASLWFQRIRINLLAYPFIFQSFIFTSLVNWLDSIAKNWIYEKIYQNFKRNLHNISFFQQ